MNTAAGSDEHYDTTVHIWNDVNLDMVNGRTTIVIVPRSALGGKSKLPFLPVAPISVYNVHPDAAFQPSAAAGSGTCLWHRGQHCPTMPFNRSDYYVSSLPLRT